MIHQVHPGVAAGVINPDMRVIRFKNQRHVESVSGSHRKANTHAQQSALLSRIHPLPGSLNTGHDTLHPLCSDKQWLIETTFSITAVTGMCTNRNYSNTHVLTGDSLQHVNMYCAHSTASLLTWTVHTHKHTQVGAHTDLHSTWASTGERWGYTHSCSRATCSVLYCFTPPPLLRPWIDVSDA